MKKQKLKAALAAATGAVVIGAALAAGPAVAAAVEATAKHVDCSATGAGTPDGTTAAPYTTLAQINAVTLEPGDNVLFKRGATCTGTFAPAGSGTAVRPITISGYGSGNARPVIDGDGAVDTVVLRNMQGVELSELEVTNAKGPASLRRGVYLVLDNYGTADHMVVDNVYVHDINGNDAKDVKGSGGILASVTGEQKASNYRGVQITNNRVEHVTRTGIAAVASVWEERTEVGTTTITKPWTANTGIVISNNFVLDTGGDGIVPQTALDAVVENNRVHLFHQRSAGYNAGIWPWNSDGSTFRFNEVSGGKTTRDGMAFDIDQGTDRTLFEYNYSHDNEGGFFLMCNAAGRVANAVVRYNVSQNDSFRGIETCSAGIESAQFYNNTIYIGPDISQTVVNENNANKRNIEFTNNLVLKEGAGTASLNLRSGGVVMAHNSFTNVAGSAADSTAVTGDPRLLGRGTATTIDAALGYQLHQSSLLTAAGLSIPGNGGRDFFGNPVPASGPVSVGAYNGPGVAGPTPPPVDGPAAPAVSNGGFESGLSGWSQRNAAAVTDPAPHGGTQSARLTSPAGSYATLEQVIGGLVVGGKYTFSGWVKSDGAPTALGLKSAGMTPSPDVLVSSTEWTQASIDFTATSTSATVFCYREAQGTALCDDLKLSTFAEPESTATPTPTVTPTATVDPTVTSTPTPTPTPTGTPRPTVDPTSTEPQPTTAPSASSTSAPTVAAPSSTSSAAATEPAGGALANTGASAAGWSMAALALLLMGLALLMKVRRRGGQH